MKAAVLHGAVAACWWRWWVSDGLHGAAAGGIGGGRWVSDGFDGGSCWLWGILWISYAIKCEVSLLLHFFIRYGTYLIGCLRGIGALGGAVCVSAVCYGVLQRKRYRHYYFVRYICY